MSHMRSLASPSSNANLSIGSNLGILGVSVCCRFLCERLSHFVIFRKCCRCRRRFSDTKHFFYWFNFIWFGCRCCCSLLLFLSVVFTFTRESINVTNWHPPSFFLAIAFKITKKKSDINSKWRETATTFERSKRVSFVASCIICHEIAESQPKVSCEMPSPLFTQSEYLKSNKTDTKNIVDR